MVGQKSVLQTAIGNNQQENRGVEKPNRIQSRLPASPLTRLASTQTLIAAAVFTIAFVLYLSTLAPSVVTVFDDSLEFQLVTYRLGIAHPTGYPLYTLLGKLFTFLPVGNVAYRVNLMSAVFGAATVALLYWLVVQLSRAAIGSLGPLLGVLADKRTYWPVHLGGIIGASLMAASPVFWRHSTVAEVYTLNTFFVVALLILATTHIQNRRHHALWLAFLAGLSLTHHRTVLLLFPALAFYLYLTQRPQSFDRKTILLSLSWGLLPLLFYLYLPLRGHVGSLDETYKNTWRGFWQHVSGGGYGLFILDNPFGHARNAAFYWDLLSSQFFTTTLAFLGIVLLLWSNQRKTVVLTGLAFFAYAGFNVFYQVSDIEVFFLPVFLLWALWSGVGAAFLLRFAAALRNRYLQLFAVGIILFAVAAGLYIQFQRSRVAIGAAHSWQVHDYGLDMLQQPLPAPPHPQSVIIGLLGEMTLIRYFQQTENRRPDIETIAADREAERLVAVEKALSEGKTVYLTRQLPGAPQRWSLSAVGPLIRVNPTPITAAPKVSIIKNQAVTPEIKLRGYNLSRRPSTGAGPAPLRLALLWQVMAPISVDLKVSARLLTQSGEVLAVVDAVPVHFAYPTTAWRSGEIVADVYDLVLPVDTPPGRYTPRIIWYDPARNAAEVGRVELAPMTITEAELVRR